MRQPYAIRLAIIDDQPQFSRQIEAWCKNHGVTFSPTRDILNSLDDARQYINDDPLLLPEIVLLDNQFPTSNGEYAPVGLDFLLELDAIRPYFTVVVFYSEQLTAETQKMARERGADIIVPKKQLRSSLESRLEHAYQLATILKHSRPDHLVRAASRFEHAERKRLSPHVVMGRTLKKHVFLITPFPGAEDQGLHKIVESVRSAVDAAGYVPLVADRAPREQLTIAQWIALHMHVCQKAIAILYDGREGDTVSLNPNLAFEVGYMSALNKQTLILNVLENTELPSDLHGSVYQDLREDHSPEAIRRAVEGWLN